MYRPIPTSPGDAPPADLRGRLVSALRRRIDELPPGLRGRFVSSDLPTVDGALRSVLARGLVRGPVFCEWGSGLGAVCALAASLAFEAHGIEIEPAFVAASRSLLDELGLAATITQGSFLRPGDEALLPTTIGTRREVIPQLAGGPPPGAIPADPDLVFAFPWPGEEDAFDRLFARRATPGALLLTYHDWSRVLVQRRTDDPDELESLGWVGLPVGG